MEKSGAQTERPKIMAMERGPGPARYSLPSCIGSQSHDYRKVQMPAFSMGRRLTTGSIFVSGFSPGPAYAIDPTVTHKGKDGTPRYSISGRHKDLEAFNTPGPGAYVPEQHANFKEKSPPAYSMGSRTKYRQRDAVPSPNTYTLPTYLGPRVPTRAASACYSMAGRLHLGGFDTDYARTPGPARYEVLDPSKLGPKSPSYSILSRNYMPGDPTKKPGPGAHSPEKCTITKKTSPSYTLGVRHSEYLCPLIIDVSD